MKLLLTACALFALCPLMADVRLDSGIVDVDYRGNHQLGGICVIEFSDDAFANASPGTPKYLAIRTSNGAVLADTLVLHTTAPPSTGTASLSRWPCRAGLSSWVVPACRYSTPSA
jgi:hypothetical protein